MLDESKPLTQEIVEIYCSNGLSWYIIIQMTQDLSDYVSRVAFALNTIEVSGLNVAIDLIKNTCLQGGKIWIIGNGGSAATASHFATDLSNCSNIQGNEIKAISLCDNSSQLTAIGNDYGFEHIFERQLKKLSMPNDLLVTISASGNSQNILNCIVYAKSNSIKTISISGFDGGAAAKISDFSIITVTNIGDYGVAEDSHSIICHYLSSKLRN